MGVMEYALRAVRPKHNGTETSKAAADKVAFVAAGQRLVVLMVIDHLRAATTDEIEVYMEEHDMPSRSHQSVSARVNDLTEMGLIEHAGIKRPTRTGSPAFAHWLTEAGLRVVEQR